jgi:hypothetical protein
MIYSTGYFDAGAIARGNDGGMPLLTLLPQRIFAKKTARLEFHDHLTLGPTHNLGCTVNEDEHGICRIAFFDY